MLQAVEPLEPVRIYNFVVGEHEVLDVPQYLVRLFSSQHPPKVTEKKMLLLDVSDVYEEYLDRRRDPVVGEDESVEQQQFLQVLYPLHDVVAQVEYPQRRQPRLESTKSVFDKMASSTSLRRVLTLCLWEHMYIGYWLLYSHTRTHTHTYTLSRTILERTMDWWTNGMLLCETSRISSLGKSMGGSSKAISSSREFRHSWTLMRCRRRPISRRLVTIDGLHIWSCRSW